MRKTKVKEIRNFAITTFALFLLTTGSVFATTATDWASLKTEVNSGNVELSPTTQTVLTDGTTLTLTKPPVPDTVVITGQNVSGTGGSYPVISANSSTVTMLDNQVNTTITNVGFTGANMTGDGGAIKNSGTLTINGTGTGGSIYNNVVQGNGGAIFNTSSGTLNISGIQLNKNEAQGAGANQGFGGAIYNYTSASDTSLSITNVSFSENNASSFGGAIANRQGHVEIAESLFEKNTSGTQGGAITNMSTLNINNSVFNENNTKYYGGAIANSLGSSAATGDKIELTITNSQFNNNLSESGGAAIYNQGANAGNYNTIVNVMSGNSFINNLAVNDRTNPTAVGGSSVGGAILNASGSGGGKDGTLKIKGTSLTNNGRVYFKGNVAENGGAITNQGIANIEYAVFENNGVTTENANIKTVNGGALYNITQNQKAVTTVKNSLFTGNQATQQGGAIYNASGKVIVMDSTFDHNKANTSQSGGAIYTFTGAETIIRANNKDTTIGYYNSETDNSIVNAEDTVAFASGATGSLQAAAGKNLTFYSNVYGNGATININDKYTDESGIFESTGTVRFANEAQITNSNIVLNNGRLSFDHDRNLGSTTQPTLANNLILNGGTLDLLNYEFVEPQLYVNNLTLNGDTRIELDVNLAAEKMDTLLDGVNVGSFGDGTNPANGNLIVSAMKSTTDTNASSVDILFTDSEYLEGHVGLDNEAAIIEGPIYQYAVKHTSISHSGGSTSPLAAGEWFNFSRLGNSNTIIPGPVAAQAAFLLMDNIYRQSFANMDMVTLMTPEERMAWKMRNKYAYADAIHRGVYAPNILPEERDGWYLRPFTNFENVPLKNGPKVSNVFYGTLIGGESDIIDLGHGWDGNFSFFGAYHGSHQAYNGSSIWQNGGSIGGVATAYKGNFFTGVTANVGASAARTSHAFGSEDFPILMTGAAWKSGYNWGLLKNKLVIQPSYMMSYTFVNVFDYTNAAGVNITQDPLHAIEFIPGIKVIGNLPNGWQPYAALNMTWIAMDRTKFYANDVALTRLGIKPFVEYGVGLQKRYGDRFTGFGQAMIRNGGRNGIAFTLGMRWALGN